MRHSRRRFTARLGAGLLGLAAAPLLAQTPAFPSKLIRIVPFGVGGGIIDTIGRVYGEKLRLRWGQPILMDAKPGASGIIAAEFVAKAPPDGYTVMMTMTITHMNNAILMSKLPYDPVKDFTPLSMLATGGPMLVARASAPYNNVKEFVAFAKKHGRMTYGTWGTGSSAHLFGALLQRQSGTELVHVPYKAEAAVHIDMFNENLDFAWANPATARSQTQGGKMKVLAIAGTTRFSPMPDVPTFKEQGFEGFDIDSWIGVYGPANMPQPVIEAWTAALREITAMPDVSARLRVFGFEPLGNTPAQFMERYKADFPRVAELIKSAGVPPE